MEQPRTGGGGGPIQTPWVQQFEDYVGAAIRITVDFDNTTRAITGGTAYRDASCLMTKILIGLGPDGTPDTTETQFTVPAGTTEIPGSAFSDLGLSTIEDVLALQITAGL
jgi:hypothetical protein